MLNLQGSDPDLSKRLIDFASGLTYAIDGGMQRVADKVFLLTPRNVRSRRKSVPASSSAAASSTRPMLTLGGTGRARAATGPFSVVRSPAYAGFERGHPRRQSTRPLKEPRFRAEVRRMSGALVLADAISTIGDFVNVFISVYVLLIFAYIITSWIKLPYSPWLNRIQRFLYDVCEPYLRIFRRILPPLGPLDLSPIIAIFSLYIVRRVIQSILG